MKSDLAGEFLAAFWLSRRSVFACVTSLAAALAALYGSDACAEHRTALLIGNTEYASRTPLASPEKDLKIIDAVLSKHGFRTVLRTNLTKEGIEAAVDRFIKAAPINGTGLIYFRGDVVAGVSYDGRATPVILGVDGEGNGLPVIDLMQWLFLHSATAQNMIVLDDGFARPAALPNGRPHGVSAKDLPDNTWLGLAKRTDAIARSFPRSLFAETLLTSEEPNLAGLLKDACSWAESTCQELPLVEPASCAVSPPERFPGLANPGDEWVAPRGTIYCYCPPAADIAGFWIGKYEVTLSKWPLPGMPAGVGKHRNDPTTLQRTKEVLARLAFLTSEERRAGRLPSDWEYALPSPQQWEHAARAGSAGDRYFEDKELVRHVNFADKSLIDTGNEDYLYADTRLDDGVAGLAPVGTYLPNAWGIHDVYGNVWEQTDVGTLCGGSWVSLPDYCRATVRKPPLDFPSDYVGLRIVLRQVESKRQ